MFRDINWEEIAFHLPTEDEFVDFEYELYGRATYRRDADCDARPHVQGDGGIGEALRLLDGCGGVPKDGRQDGLDGKIPTYAYSDYPSPQTQADITQHSDSHSTSTVSPMQVGQSDRGREGGDVCMRSMWPDPVTGCVYGGACALLVGCAEKSSACVHSPLQQDRLFRDRCKVTTRRQFSRDHAGGVVPFASRSRWRTHYR